MDGAVWLMMCSPVAIEPVSDTIRTLGCPVSGSPTVLPLPNSTLITPAGKISFASSANFNAVSGVISDGLSTTQFPAASAGASFHAAIISG
ncbi:amino acid transporter [Escherichia coli]|nr:amino acid transporter [Escherichia coli]GDF52298.1 hypothetical protein HmCmsJML288_00835 [Escherichia coli]